MNIDEVVICVLEAQSSVQESILKVLSELGANGRCFFASTELMECLLAARDNFIALVNAHFPPGGGLEILEQIQKCPHPVPVILYSAVPDVLTSVAAIKRGATDFLVLPLDLRSLQDSIRDALCQLKSEEERNIFLSNGIEMYNRLTRREREVFELAASGMLNKQIAGKLGIAEKTVKIHRSRVMSKLGLGSIAQLVQFYLRLQPPSVIDSLDSESA